MSWRKLCEDLRFWNAHLEFKTLVVAGENVRRSLEGFRVMRRYSIIIDVSQLTEGLDYTFGCGFHLSDVEEVSIHAIPDSAAGDRIWQRP